MPSRWSPNPKQNRILAALPDPDFERLVDDLVPIQFSLGQVLYGSSDTLTYVYFPINCIVSLVYTTQNGSSAELAMTGCDGLVGFPLLLGGETTPHKVVVQSAGWAYRLGAEVARWEFDQAGNLQRLALRYTQALMTQMAQSVVCNRHHSVDQQLCRWLLLSLDQLPVNELTMTQELIANMLGVRREAVTEAAGKLQAAGMIRYRRGHISVLDRPGLEQRVCECYNVVRSEYERLFRLDPNVLRTARNRPNPVTLRQRAEARMQREQRASPQANAAPVTAWDTERLVHELQVHTVELEMHNEELREAYDESDALRSKYADIYDFAPVGYFTLDPLGIIVQLNLAGAILLGIKRSECGRRRFVSSVKPEFWGVFNHFLDEVLLARSRKHCELVLSATEQRHETVIRVEATTDESGRECRLIAIDITAEKEAQKAQQAREEYQRALLDNFPYKVWLKDEQGRFLAVNAPFAESQGWASVSEAIGLTDFDIAPPAEAKASRAADMKVLASGEKLISEERVAVDGESRWMETFRSPVVMEGLRIGTVGFSRDISERKRAETELRNLAATDPLTELANRRHFIARLEEAFASHRREADHMVTVLMLDIDHFKRVNDSLGHAAGDAVLKLFSALLRDELRAGDTAGRMGGEEFAVLMPRSDLAAAGVFAERIRQKVAGTVLVMEGRKVAITVSIGLASMAPDDTDAQQVLLRADNALYQAKASGRNRVECAGLGVAPPPDLPPPPPDLRLVQTQGKGHTG